MINPFPTLLDFGLLAPAMLRLTLGAYFIYLGWIKLSKKKDKKEEENIPLWENGEIDILGSASKQKFSHKHISDILVFFDSLSIGPAVYYIKTLALAEIIAGLFLCVGFFTQISAIITAVISIVSFIVAYKHRGLSVLKPGEYLLLTVISLSLLFSGAGILAIDLPL